MQRVFVASGEMHAQQVRAFLEASGIPSMTHGETLRNMYGLTLNGLGAVDIMVDDAHVEQARALIASAEKGELRLR